MAKVIRTFSEIDHAVSEMQYWIQHGDYEKVYSNRGYVLEQSRALMRPAYIYLWMIMYPLEGQERTRPNNISSLASWLYQIATRTDGKISLLSVYAELSGGYLRAIKSELHENHSYLNLNGHPGKEISNKMADILTEVTYDSLLNRKTNKHYQISLDTIQGIIKEVLGIE